MSSTRTHQVGEDQQAALVHPLIDPGTQYDGEEIRGPDRRGQPCDLIGRRVERRHGDQGQREFGDPVAELRYGLSGPEANEPPVL
ncbi:hypothetical protein ACFQ0G_51250 [Streptomyces chiangmaiensis]